MSDIDISEPLSDMLAPLNNEQKEFLMIIIRYKPTKRMKPSTVKEKRHII